MAFQTIEKQEFRNKREGKPGLTVSKLDKRYIYLNVRASALFQPGDRLYSQVDVDPDTKQIRVTVFDLSRMTVSQAIEAERSCYRLYIQVKKSLSAGSRHSSNINVSIPTSMPTGFYEMVSNTSVDSATSVLVFSHVQ